MFMRAFIGAEIFQKLDKSDCNVNNDIHSLERDDSPNYDNCQEWCINNGDCGAFAVYRGTCYFKDRSCRNDLKQASSTNLFLTKGSQVYY